MTVSGRFDKHCSTIDEAMRVLSRLVAEQDGGDKKYFESQSHRFRYASARINDLCPKPCRVLDIGSHYLHQASLLRLLGHEVIGVDVPIFSTADFVVERSRMMGITNVTVTSLEGGNILADGDYDGMFDLIVFTAILEHITFNPVSFWRRIYELMSDRGIIYLTTPNGLRPAAMLKHFLRLVTFTGVGIPVRDILETITYGHHWKEYSSTEIKEYFRILSPDFNISINWYNDKPSGRGIRGTLAKCAGFFPFFRPEIEAVVSLSGKTGFQAAIPELPMAASSRRR